MRECACSSVSLISARSVHAQRNIVYKTISTFVCFGGMSICLATIIIIIILLNRAIWFSAKLSSGHPYRVTHPGTNQDIRCLTSLKRQITIPRRYKSYLIQQSCINDLCTFLPVTFLLLIFWLRPRSQVRLLRKRTPEQGANVYKVRDLPCFYNTARSTKWNRAIWFSAKLSSGHPYRVTHPGTNQNIRCLTS